ncbi:hypothetical protein [Pseudoalteromonas prydzensis]|uniref:hypothetical protein n=1 Tax=Pseudoalteromonas prydzensis TaxID=182141 RepID=UPI003FD5273D
MRAQLIQMLTNSMNVYYNSALTLEQVECWVGSDADNKTIEEFVVELDDSPETAVTPDDVISLWDN